MIYSVPRAPLCFWSVERPCAATLSCPIGAFGGLAQRCPWARASAALVSLVLCLPARSLADRTTSAPRSCYARSFEQGASRCALASSDLALCCKRSTCCSARWRRRRLQPVHERCVRVWRSVPARRAPPPRLGQMSTAPAAISEAFCLAIQSVIRRCRLRRDDRPSGKAHDVGPG